MELSLKFKFLNKRLTAKNKKNKYIAKIKLSASPIKK